MLGGSDAARVASVASAAVAARGSAGTVGIAAAVAVCDSIGSNKTWSVYPNAYVLGKDIYD